MNSAAPNNREKEIFERALDLESAAERPAFVKGACGADAPLCARVLALLAAHEADPDFLPEAPEDATVAMPATERPGDRIGRYTLREKIGEGGCGLVYVAEQEEPVRRRVALKVIKLGMDTRQVVARFEAERQALAMMDHPNIAKVFDAGATDTGRPFFVMELVRGIRITDYCDQYQLATPQRLDLFIQVCHAIQHAHQKGIIHRDIKPSNVLVTLHDPGSPGVPKVIDFGIAKAIAQKLTEKTLYTAFEQFIGTPAYTSPEQAEMSGLDIDTRSDIYALGVLLYELLTGKTPFDGQELIAAGLEEMRRTIREKEPVRPSTRLRTMLDRDLTTTAQRRRTEAPQLIHLLRGDLDWIVMKCLEKDRTRRYDTANGLALDIERHLTHEPVAARPPSTAYRLQKFVRRNKVMVSAVTTVAVALVLGIVASTWQAVRATRAEREQTHLRTEAQANEQKALAAEANEARLRKQAQLEAYASDMKAVQVALQEDNRGMAVSLLRQYFPKAGRDDWRGVEWRYLWQETRGDELRSFPHPTMVHTAVLSREGRYLASMDLGGTARIWEAASGRKVWELAVGTDLVMAGKPADFSGDGRWLALAAKGGVEIREASSWSVIRKLESAGGPICFSPDSRLLATRGTNGVFVWDLSDWTHRVLTNASVEMNNLAFSPDGTTLALGHRMAQQFQAWDLRTGAVRVTGRFDGPESIGISPDGRWLVSGNAGGEVGVWNLATLEPVLRFPAHRGHVIGLACSPDGNLLATGGNDQRIHLWRSGTTNRVATLKGHASEIWSLQFSRDGQTLVSGSKDGTAKLWNVKPARGPSQSFTLPTNCIPEGVLPEGTALVAGNAQQRTTQIWSFPGGQLLRSFPWSQFDPEGCRDYSHFPQSEVVLGISTNGTVHFWSLKTGGHLRSVPLGETNLQPMDLTSDGRWLLGVDHNQRRFTLYDLRAGRRMEPPVLSRPTASGFGFSPDGRWLAYHSTNYTLKLWDLAANREHATLAGHGWFISALRFSPDSKVLASGGWEGDVWLWSVETGKPLRPPLRAHRAGLKGLVFSSDGATLVTEADDMTIRWWSLATGKEMIILQDLRMAHSATEPYARPAQWDLGGKTLVWRGRLSWLPQFTTLPTLAEIDAAEAAANTPAAPR